MWLFRKKQRIEVPSDQPEAPRPPIGAGWRPWFEISARAAQDPPWSYEWVELWRPDWETPRVTRSSDIPYELNGPGFWWRPHNQPDLAQPLTIEG